MTGDIFRLDGKVALVTGGTGHLGRALCEGLAGAGASVALTSTKAEKAESLAAELERAYDVAASGYELDLSDSDAIYDTVSKTVERFGRFDCLVNNAYFGAANELSKMTATEWSHGIDGSVSSHFYMLQACLPHLEKTSGCVINIGSMYGIVSPDPSVYAGTSLAGNPVNYGVGKAALLQLTRYAAVHLAEKGIRVNAISPGAFPSNDVMQDEDFVSNLSAKIPLGRIGRPDELRGAIVFLASSAASYVTGHNLVVDGGWTVW